MAQSQSTGEHPRFKVWASNNLGNTEYAVSGPEEAVQLIRKLGREQLQDTRVIWNVFGLIELEEDGYHEWYDEAGNDVDALLDS